jgi:prepilin-type N-terminal cleavage/methylation domain-containing protein
MPQRRGFTLIEVLVALVIMGIVTGAIYRLLNTNQRLSLAQAEQVTLQSNVRTGSLVVPNELREVNTFLGSVDATQNDILVAEDDEIEYRAMRGLGFVCQDPVAPVTELRLASATWTGLRLPQVTRDTLYLFWDQDPDDDDDDEWVQVAITGVETSGNACGGAAGITLDVAPVAPAVDVPDVPLYTPVRVFERMELKLHAADGEWWLGARSVSADEDLQPVLGPLTAAGFDLDYLDGVGNETADKSAIRSIRVSVRGLTDDAVRAGGFGALGRPQEGLVTQVLLRNSIRP